MGYIELLKAENPEAYKKLAEKGIMVGHPVTIAGQTHRADNGIAYHSTVKFFNPDKDKPEHVHDTAKNLNFIPPDPKKTNIEPGMFKDRMGNDVYVIKLHGEHADTIKENHKKFSHLGYPATYEYTPHVSVDKATWDKIVASKAKTAHEAGISFGPAQLKQGHNTLATYHPRPAEEAPKVTVPPTHPTQSPKKLASSEGMKKSLDEGSILDAIRMNMDLREKHSKCLNLRGEILSNYMQDNPDLMGSVMKKHEERLKFHFGEDQDLINVAWEKGIKEAYRLKGNR